MSKKDAILEVIYEAIADLNDDKSEDEKVAATMDAILFGPESGLDSLDLVSLIVDVEGGASDLLDKSVSLSDDNAMDQDPVPFTSVASMLDYIMGLADEK